MYYQNDVVENGMPVQQMPVQQMPVQQMPVQQMPVQQMPVQQMPVQQMPVQQKSEIVVTELQVSRPRIVNTQKGQMYFFDLVLNGVKIYGCKLANRKTDARYFVSFPSQKNASNGEYYPIVSAKLPDAAVDEIIRQLGANGNG